MRDEKLQEFLDDCVAMAEALRCMQDKGAESILPDGATLKEEIFDRCFPGAEWTPVTVDGTVVCLLKEAKYRGFLFDCVRDQKEAEG